MSEEFYMQINIELPSEQHQNDIEALIEHLELYENEQAKTLINNYKPELMASHFTSAFTAHSNYDIGDDVIKMYLTCYDESVDDMEVTRTNSPLGMEFTIEGNDNSAADFGSAFLLLLIAMSASNIQAQAGTDYWQAHWCEKTNGLLTVTLKEFEQ
ncbi:hypothetical protein [Colwellia sp. TT2012]|uniref:hypothetical protein n=1 Tax=Colwellia sp. TT2012 TaxID=1720342 RepID=UPI00070F0B25|nr:hypothetical protein [Colwellia sp. TT2012]